MIAFRRGLVVHNYLEWPNFLGSLQMEKINDTLQSLVGSADRGCRDRVACDGA
jgi:hypothetical protein